jgi:DNA-nicking Smr family endonuclease
MTNKRSISEADASLWATLTRSVIPLNTLKSLPPPEHKLPRNIIPNYIFEPILDLHGHTVHEAYNHVDRQIHQAHQIGHDKVTIITGKSGPISSEFAEWVKHRSEIKKSKPKNDGGAWDIWIKRT